MRRVRPTVKVLRQLPADSFVNPGHADLIARNRWQDLAISQIQHALLDDAGRYFSRAKRPDHHRASTVAARMPVFEARSRSGAAWRGAVILDDAGDPWLVYAARHDEFNSSAARHLQAVNAPHYMPSSADYKLRAQEEALAAEALWRAQLLGEVLRGVREAIESGGRAVKVTLPGAGQKGPSCPVEIEVAHDPPAQEIEQAHTVSSMVTVRLTLRGDREGRVERATLQEVIPFLQPDPEGRGQAYGKGGELHIWMTVTQAQLVQVLAAAAVESHEVARARCSASAPTHLHYVASPVLMEAFVVGDAVRAICGTWFVPTRDETTAAGMPICMRCESERPIAERVLDLLGNRMR